MSFLKLILLTIILSGILSCSDHVVNNYYDTEVGFTFYANPSYDSLISLDVFADKILNSIPVIKLDGRFPDTPQINITGCWFSGLKPNQFVHYEIDYSGDTLKDSIFIRGSIDSLFVDNQFAAKNDSILIQIDSAYTLSWKDKYISNKYTLSISTAFGYRLDTSLSSSSIVIALDTNRFNRFEYYMYPFIDIYIYNMFFWERGNYTVPDKRSKYLFAFYDIGGQVYHSRLIFNPFALKKVKPL